RSEALAHVARVIGFFRGFRRKRDAKDATVDGAPDAEAARAENLQHAVVLAEHAGLELVDAVFAGEPRQTLEKQCRYAAALVRIGDRESHLRALRLAARGWHRDILGYADDLLLTPFAQRRHQRHVANEVDLGEAPELVVREPELRAEEPE